MKKGSVISKLLSSFFILSKFNEKRQQALPSYAESHYSHLCVSHCKIVRQSRLYKLRCG
jgi:hypothetical protein